MKYLLEKGKRERELKRCVGGGNLSYLCEKGSELEISV